MPVATDLILALASDFILPVALISIMFSLGVTVSVLDIRRLLRFPRAIVIGAAAQIILLPTMAFALAAMTQLPAVLGMSLIVIAACPGGITSNAITFYGRADVPLSILITSLSSLITVFTAPVVIALGLARYAEIELHSIPNLAGMTGKLLLYSTTPLVLGMLVRVLWTETAAQLVRVLRPMSLGILLTVIVFSILVNRDLVTNNIFEIAPIAILLNGAGMLVGVALGRRFRLRGIQCATLGVEVGVQNVTMATFVGMSVLGHPALAAVPTIYGIIMVSSALVFLSLWRRRYGYA